MNKEEAIEILSEMRSEYNLFGDEEEATRYHVLSWAIKKMNGEPVELGEWIMDRTGAEYCSECGKYPFDDGEYHIAGWHSDYCPHCGAKMDVPDTNIGKMDEGYPNAINALDALEDEE